MSKGPMYHLFLSGKILGNLCEIYCEPYSCLHFRLLISSLVSCEHIASLFRSMYTPARTKSETQRGGWFFRWKTERGAQFYVLKYRLWTNFSRLPFRVAISCFINTIGISLLPILIYAGSDGSTLHMEQIKYQFEIHFLNWSSVLVSVQRRP